VALETEQMRLVVAFGKGYIGEADLEVQIDRIRAELQSLPLTPPTANMEKFIAMAISAGETLTEMAGYWREALPAERRDIVWVIMPADGLIYDLERREIAGVLPRPDMLPALAICLGLHFAGVVKRFWHFW
jgi:hypothetical protein